MNTKSGNQEIGQSALVGTYLLHLQWLRLRKLRLKVYKYYEN